MANYRMLVHIARHSPDLVLYRAWHIAAISVLHIQHELAFLKWDAVAQFAIGGVTSVVRL